MKRALLFLVAASFVVLSACAGPEGPAGKDGTGYTGKTAVIPLIVLDSSNEANALSAAGGAIVTVGWNGRIFTSPDAKTWTNRSNTDVTSSELFSVANNGGSVFVAVGSSDTIVRSTDDGATWAVATTVPLASALNGVAYGAGAFVAVGSGATGGGVIFTSTDGGNVWTSTTPGSPPAFNSVSFANGSFFAGTQSGNLYSSANGSSWSGALSTFLSASVLGVSYGGNTYLATDSVGDINSSSNAADWVSLYLGIDADSFSSQCFGFGGFAVLTRFYNTVTSKSIERIYWTPDAAAWYQASILPRPDGAYTSINWVPSIGSFVVTQMPAL
jgi:hypothetical protein